MPFVLFVVGLPLGSLLGAFLVLQPLIIMFFGMPFTRALNKDDLLHGAPVMTRLIVSLVLLTTLCVLAVVALEIWAPTGLRRGIFVGAIWATVKGLNRVGMNTANLSDYVQANGRYMDASTVAEMEAMIAADTTSLERFAT